MLIHFFFIVLGVALVTYGAKFLVEGASSLAKRFDVSDMVIGLTVVSFGTSAPEMIVSVLAAANGTPEVAIGNVIGSNTANICLILGLTAILQPLRIRYNTIWKDIPFSFVGIIVALFMAGDLWLDQSSIAVITRSEGLVLLCFFAIYMYYVINLARKGTGAGIVTEEVKHKPLWLAIGMVVAGLAGLVYGGKFMVDAAIAIARGFGISEAIIGLTLVAVGTSVPELATSIVAALKGRGDMAIGNVVGSNIFNIFFILGTSATVAPLPIGNITLVDFGVCIAATLLMFIAGFVMKPNIMYRPKGWVLLGFYVVYLGWLVSQAA
ncbi:MAG: calcium/sodium antiporter [Saprospiraceae bacterium]|jgi:cation:H+ antiporter|nr:calcium/sodium antiporter [Saprospiraceae bacterium]